jgi:hypothetical protein
MEKQRDKAAQRLQRKQTKLERGPDESPYEMGEPISFDDDVEDGDTEKVTE